MEPDRRPTRLKEWKSIQPGHVHRYVQPIIAKDGRSGGIAIHRKQQGGPDGWRATAVVIMTASEAEKAADGLQELARRLWRAEAAEAAKAAAAEHKEPCERWWED